MKGNQFKQFAEEVLHKGATAVLPQHLPERWLDALLEEAEIFQQDDASEINNTCAGLLGAVLTILYEQAGHPEKLEIPAETMMRCLDYYIITLSAESVNRRTDIAIEPPTLENIFQADREMRATRRPLGPNLH